jgi:putative ABC transport system permease protein
MSALLVRTSGNPETLSNAFREAVRSVDHAQPVFDLKSMDDRVSATLARRQFAVALLGIFAAVAVFMAALGLYGVINYNVAQRTQEIGIRMALGAQRRQVLGLVMLQGVRMTMAGIVLGLAGAFYFARLIATELFQVSAFDPATFGFTAAVLFGVAILASYVPGRRATKIDPLVACRYE